MAAVQEEGDSQDSKSKIESSAATKQVRRTSVSFAETPPQVQKIDIDETEVQDRWYSHGEYFFIKKEALNLVRRMSTTRIDDTDTVSTRGLEILDDTKVKRRRATIDNTVQSVLEAQKQAGTSDPDSLSPAYRKMTRSSISHSIQTATEDARDAREYLDIAGKKSNHKNRIFKTPKFWKKMSKGFA